MVFLRTLLSIITGLIIASSSALSWAKASIIPWGSLEGIQRLEASAYKVDFFKLASHFEFQENKLFCGPATSSIILNALRLRKSSSNLPKDTTVMNAEDLKYIAKTWSPIYARYTQNTIFLGNGKSRAEVLGKKPLNAIEGRKDFGFQLRQLNDLLIKHGTKTILRVADKSLTLEKMKKEMRENLAHANDYVVVNFQRSVLTPEKVVGHFSPIAAYHQASDSFLLLDVTPNQSGWIWVDASLLLQAMKTFDTIENRGYILVSDG